MSSVYAAFGLFKDPLNKLSTYNISSHSEKRLREMIHHLVLNDFLFISDDEYPVLRLGARANEILRENAIVEMKLVKEEIHQKPEKKAAKINPVSNALFEILRTLRLEIANEQKVPAFVIFADSALTDMCVKLPTNAEEFTKVSGVGQVKLERYGERFLRAISEFLQMNNIPESDVTETLNPEDIEISDEAVTITVIADRINCVLLKHGLTTLSGVKVNNWLVKEGYLEVITDENKNFKLPTLQGEEAGITTEKRLIRGEDCFINSYSRRAQQLIVDNLSKIMLHM